ncbi:MAG: hypothetical protein GX446_10780 [Chthonomonadales bacterium]|nr:hypothetical protein [Chthonomonadales bacterium]
MLRFRGAIGSHELDAQGNVVVKGAEEWAEAFWQYLKEGQTVSEAAQNAARGIPPSKGLGNRQILGSLKTRVHPARYGN